MQVAKSVESNVSKAAKKVASPAVVPGSMRSLNAAAPEGEVRRIDSYRVAPAQLLLDEVNVRLPNNPDLREHIDNIKALIKSFLENATNPKDKTGANGLSEIIQPIRVVLKNGKLHVIDGFCRTTAIQELVAEGYVIELVDVIAQTDSSPDGIIFTMLSAANGLPVLPIETAVAYARLADDLAMSPAAITKELNERGKKITIQRVEQLLLLGRADSRIHDLVLQDKIKADAAIVIIRQYRGDRDAAVKAVEEMIANAGGAKVGRSTYSVPKKHQESIVKSIGADRDRLQSVLESVKGNGSNKAWVDRPVQISIPAGVVEKLLKQLSKGE